jgi:hypothetical protein
MMKKIILALAVLIILNFSIVKSQNAKVDTIVFTIENSLPDVVYIGIKNFLEVKAEGIPDDRIRLDVNKGKLERGVNRKTGESGYVLLVSDLKESGQKIVLSISVDTDTSLNFIENKEIRAIMIPEPTPLFGSKPSGTITKDQISYVRYITVVLENFVYQGIIYRVTSYRFILIDRRSGKVYEEEVEGYKLTDEIKKRLKDTNSGDIIIVKDIHVTRKGIKDRLLKNSIVLEVE